MKIYIMVFLSALFCTLHTPAAYAENGVSQKTVLIGQSAALSGPAQELGIELRDGAQAYFDYINSQGGISGRQIVLKTLDDGYEPERAAANTRKLIEKEGVFALFGYVGTPTSSASLPLVDQSGMIFFAPFTGSKLLREPFNRNIFNVRASYEDEADKIVDNAMHTMGVKRIAVLYQNDAFGKSGLEAVAKACKRRNIEPVGTASVERNSTDVSAAIAKFKQLKPQAIIILSAYASSAAFIKGMIADVRKESGPLPLFWNISFVGSQMLSRELGSEGRGVLISQVVPAPWDGINVPVVKEYKTLYLNKPGREPGFVSLEGFIAAKVFVEGLRRTGEHLSRERFVHAMETMGTFNLGGFEVKFSPDNHNASSFVDLTIISRDGKFLH